METRSVTDFTLFFWSLSLFILLAFTFSIPFWDENYFEKVSSASIKHILIAIGYVTVFIFFPLLALSWTVIRFVVTNDQIRVIDWFGLRRRTYSLPIRQNLKIGNETAPYRFRYFPINSKYNKFITLYLTTAEGKKLRIQSRYYKNFEELNIAIRKACL
jgi:hypothetical protein